MQPSCRQSNTHVHTGGVKELALKIRFTKCKKNSYIYKVYFHVVLPIENIKFLKLFFYEYKNRFP